MTKDTFKILCSFVGLYLLFLTIGLHLYWGNLSVYTNSYLWSKLGPDPSINTPWVISLFTMGWTVSGIASSYIAGFIGQRCAMILGCVLLNSGVILTYFAVQRSVLAMNLSMGLLVGLGAGLVFSMGLQKIVSFEPPSVGIATATIETAISAGGVLFNLLITHYVNPDNLTPDFFDGQENYFTQDMVLRKVPSVFLVVGLINLCCHVTGILLAHQNAGADRQTYVQSNAHVKSHRNESTEQNEFLKSKSPSTNEISHKSQSKVKEETHTDTDSPAVSAPVENLSPTQILKCKSFYALWFCYSFCDYSYIVLTNFFKSYGQIWIPDDHFLAKLATAQLITMMLTRPFWGMFMDKQGVKFTLMVLSCALCVIPAFWYFTPMVCRWTFLVWTLIFGSCNATLYTVFPVSILTLYGKANFTSNFGFVMSSNILLNLIAPLIIRCVLGHFGWFYLFFSAACGNALGTILCILLLPGS